MTDVKSQAKSPARQKRVKRLKRIIVGFIITMMIVPLTLALILGIRLGVIKRELIKTQEELNFYLEQQSEQDFAERETGITDGLVSGKSDDTADLSTDSNAAGNSRDEIIVSDAELADLTLSEDELYDGYRRVYLTFDDGPSSNTDDILDILKEYNVKATFFVIKKEGRNFEKLYRRIVEEGHTIGMHSCTHEYSVVYAGRDEFMADTKDLRNYIYLVTGVESNFYRFPGGSSNRVSRVDVKTLAKDLHNEGIEYYDWNLSSQDSAGGIHSAGDIFYNSTNRIKDYNDVIILFHDTNSKVTTVEALPEIIKYIQSLDNTVILPITEDTRPIQHLSAD